MSQKSPFRLGSGTNLRLNIFQEKAKDAKEGHLRPLSQGSDNDSETFSDSEASSIKSFDLESISQASSNMTPRSLSPSSDGNIHSPLPYSFTADSLDLLRWQASIKSPSTSLLEESIADLPADSDMRQTLLKIREKMAKSLLRLKELEEQVKNVPTLHVRISVLQEEKRQLMKQLQAKNTQRKTRKKDFSVYSFRQRGCISDTENDDGDDDDEYAAIRKRLRLKLNSRSVGVGNFSINDSLCDCPQQLNYDKTNSCSSVGINVSVQTNEKSCLSQMVLPEQDCNVVPKLAGSPVRTRSIGVGMMRSFTKDVAVGDNMAIKNSKSTFTQVSPEMTHSACDPMQVHLQDVGISVKPVVSSVQVSTDISDTEDYKTYSFTSVGVQTDPCSSVVSVGSGICTIDDEFCEKCKNVEFSRISKPVDEIIANNIDLPVFKSVGVGNSSINDDYLCDKCSVLETHSIGVGEHLATVDKSLGDESIYDVMCDKCASVETSSCGVGDSSVHDVICDKCTNLKTKSQGVGSFCITDTICDKCDSRKTRTVGVGESGLKDLLCDKCENTKTASVGINCVATSVTVGVSECCISDNYCDRCLHIRTNTIGVGDCCVTDSFCERCFNVQMKSVAVGDFDVNKDTCSSSVSSLKSVRNHISTNNNNYIEENGEVSHSDLASLISKKYIQQGNSEGPERLKIKQNGISHLSVESDSSIDQDNPSSDSASQVSDGTETSSRHRHPSRVEEPVIVACKLLNGHLYKGKEIGREQMVSCMATIETHWVQMISSKHCNSNQMKTYIKTFDHHIPLLLETIVNLTDKNGNNALHYAVSFRNYSVVELLLNMGLVNVDKTNKAGYSTIMMLALTGVNKTEDVKLAKRLLEAGNVNKRVLETGQTPLMLAASRGRLDSIELLLDGGADINAIDDDGSTALMCACEHGHTDVARRLLAHPECNSSLADNDGSTAISIAMEHKFKDIALLIYGHGSLPRLRRTKSSTVV